MFEAFVTLCMLAGAPENGGGDPPCRMMLLPGYSAENRTTCEAAVEARPPAWLSVEGTGEISCQARPGSTLSFSEIAPGVFVHRGAIAEPDPENGGDAANIGFVIGERSIAAIDAGGSRRVGEELYLAIRARSPLPVSQLILTHMHPDHVFGAEVLREAGAEIVGHSAFPRAISERAKDYEDRLGQLIGLPGFIGSRIIGPDRTVSGPETIDLGGRELVIEPRPTAHTATDLTVLDKATGTLFLGDLLFDTHTPTLDGSLRGWIEVMSALKDDPAQRVVPGHGGPMLPWPEAIAPQMRYLEVLAADTRAALHDGLSLGEATDVIGRSEAGKWQLFELYNPRNATAAYTELEWE
ncbi:quinoprotein relay system zinc metallohydrolase 2 [Roseibium salinum]|uniref:Quinoprotein relay system zinc metallohydrolase 2 n=1 Tax=Roseibium salinum TaxID=1604349 RepID=A0ABT3R4S2_9HYPH|nr:quinoprotein relay system zinc metallohydrolase 2 [Roseibium sp. DSM 29163]MCX2723997.1 quinoprotein relay system zinc metallohydrolase 2 [Roseibium sp. DSM 29163]